jgi:hypothetical protein
LCCMSSDLLCFVTCLPVSEMSLIMFWVEHLSPW